MLRRSLHLVLPTCLVAAALTAPAWSAPPFTPACQGDSTCLGTDEPASGDGVVVHWRVQSATRQTIALESRQPLAGGGTILTATTATVIVEAGAVRELDARLPIADRGVLAIAGATGPIQAEGVVERDQDGDGYGDGRQDGCSKDFNAHVAPCPARTSFGSALTLAPDPAGFSPAGGGPTAVVQEPNTAPVARAPLDGVITAFRVRSASTVPLTLQTLRPAGSGAYTVTGAAAPATPAPGGAVTTVTGVRLPVRAGDQLGLRAPGDLGAVAPSGSGLRAFGAPLPAVGETATPQATVHELRLLAQADVEPDADGDGYGDLTQDACPADPARQAACQADLAVTPPLTASPPFTPLVLRPCVNVVRGTRDDDVLRGTAFGDRLVGSDGDDLLKGDGADDCLEGGTGSDVLDGGDGDDRLAGSSGKDRLIGGRGADKLTGGSGNDRLSGGLGNDTISPGSGRDTVLAGPGDDAINSVDGVRETIDCGSGRDTVRADRRDRLRGCEKVKRR